MEMVTTGFILAVFGAGLLSFFSPCVLPLLPVYIGYLSGGMVADSYSRSISFSKALAFTGGLSASFFLLGFGAGALGGFINSHYFFLACGALVVIFGIHQSGLIRIPLLNNHKSLDIQFNPQKGLVGAFALGFLFSFGWTPCVGPILGAVLGISSQQGSAFTGGGLLLVYSFGLSVPFVILALGSQQILSRVKGIYPHFGKIRIVGGMLIIFMGSWMIYNQVQLMQAEKQSSPDSQLYAVAPSVYKLSLSTLHGAKVSLSELQGKTVYVKFWTTWCPLCLAGLEEFAALEKQYKDSEGVAIISVVTPGLNGEVGKEDFIAWAESQQLSFPILFDETGSLTREFGIRAYPSAVYLNKDGKVFKKTVGDEIGSQIQSTLSIQN